MFVHALGDWLSMTLDEAALQSLDWKDFKNGLRMARLTRQAEAEIVLYRVESESHEPFLRHEHIGGELYLVLRGTVEDEHGAYQQGDFVYLEPGTIHTPRASSGTIILVMWPKGVRIVE